MDGNRRFAVQKCATQRVIEGHKHGFEKLMQCLEWCLTAQIQQVTVYAFSLDNYKRSTQELQDLMSLAYDKFQLMLQHTDMIHTYQVQVRICGCRALLSPRLQSMVRQVEDMSKGYTRCILNICMSYTSSCEVTEAVGAVSEAVRDGRLLPSDVSEQLIDSQLYTCVKGFEFDEQKASRAQQAEVCVNSSRADGSSACKESTRSRRSAALDLCRQMSGKQHSNDESQNVLESPLVTESCADTAAAHKQCTHIHSYTHTPIDILIRTSGETRLSDFLSSQVSSSTLLCFCREMWPAFRFADFVAQLVAYQHHVKRLESERRQAQLDAKQRTLKRNLAEAERKRSIEAAQDDSVDDALFARLQRERRQRINRFLFASEQQSATALVS